MQLIADGNVPLISVRLLRPAGCDISSVAEDSPGIEVIALRYPRLLEEVGDMSQLANHPLYNSFTYLPVLNMLL